MGIHYKIDYEKTLVSMKKEGESIELKSITSIETVRTQVSNTCKRLKDADLLPKDAKFSVSKNAKGATITRTA